MEIIKKDKGFSLSLELDIDVDIYKIDISKLNKFLFTRHNYEAMLKEFPDFGQLVKEYGYYVEELDQILFILDDELIESDDQNICKLTHVYEEIPWKELFKEQPKFEWTEPRKSTVCDGNGVFAKKFIPKGSIYFDLCIEPYITIDQTQYEAVKKNFPDFCKYVNHFGFYLDYKNYIGFILTQNRFMNHSDTPNGGSNENELEVGRAQKDIEEGEELFENYRTFCFCPWNRLYGDLVF